MRSLLVVGVGFIIALGSAPAWSQTGASTQATPPGPVKKVANPDEVICVRQTSIDTRIPGKPECHTRKVWDEMSDSARTTAQDFQQRSGMMAPSTGGVP